MNINESEIKISKIKEFMLNLQCLDELTPYTDKLNIFKILKTQNMEIRHSNFLAWLLDVSESHNLKDKFISNLINETIKKNKEFFDVNDWVLLDYTNEKVIREWKGKTNSKKYDSLDLLIEINNKTNKRLIAIENKVYAKESSGQTTKYRKAIEYNEKYKDYKKMYIFLTPYGEDPEDFDWATLTYSEIKTILENILQSSKLDEKVLILINDYIKILEEITMDNKELEKICTKIYNQYKEELNIIFDYKIDDVAEMANYLKDTLKKLSQNNSNIIYNEKFNSGVTYVRFATQNLNNKLGYASNNNNCWNNNQRYLFEFHPRELNSKDALKIFFTLTLDNNEDDENAKERAIKICKSHNSSKKIPKKTVNLWKETIIEDAIDFINNANDDSKLDLESKILKYIEKIEKKVEKVI